MTDIVSIKNLNVTFHEANENVYAVNSVNLTLHQGETLALVGESGSGKSVTTHALLGLLGKDAEVKADVMRYGDTDLLHASKKAYTHLRGQELGLIFQDSLSGPNPTMRIGRQIGEGVKAHQHLHGAALKKAVYASIQDVGLDDPALIARKYPHELSGGQRQRAMIAMALIMHPKVLVADEPTTALDVTIQAQIIHMLKEIQSKIDTSIIFITHDLGVVAGIADRVAVMYEGKIVEYGTVDEIFYNAQHPYTWGLLEAMPTLETKTDRLYAIPGTPPDLLDPPKGDAFAPRNPYAMAIDLEEEPPFFKISPTHAAATWLLAPGAPKVELPPEIARRHALWASKHPDEKAVN